MLDLVLWFFVIALTPWALGLGLKLISDVRVQLGSIYSENIDEAERMGPRCPLNPKNLSSSRSMSCSWH